LEAHKCPLDALAQHAIFTLPPSAFLLPPSFAQIPNIGYNRRRKQTRASASVVLFFNAVSCSFAV
jgi:hypothetical protein